MIIITKILIQEIGRREEDDMAIAQAFMVGGDSGPEDLKAPGNIKLDDGREILIREWKPCARMDDVVSVTVEGILTRMPNQSSPMQINRPGPPYYKWL